MTAHEVPDRACNTCPYRRDTPPGIWDASEYEKLRAYDLDPPTSEEGLALFRCHQSNATGVPTVCRGWLAVHRESVAVRLAQAFELITPEQVPLEAEPLYYATGAEACEAGLAGVPDPTPEAQRAIRRLIERKAGRP